MNRNAALLGPLAATQSIQLHAATLTWDANAAKVPNPHDGTDRPDSVVLHPSQPFATINAILTGTRGITANVSF